MITILALALGWKIGLSILIGIVGFFLVIFFALFGPGAQPETGGESSSWITVAIIAVLAIAALWIAGCTVNTPSAGNQVAYRINETGSLGGADESSCVVHYYTDAPGIFHDCEPQRPGAKLRTWQQFIIYINGRPSRIFQEISGPQAAARDCVLLEHRTQAPRCEPRPCAGGWLFPDWPDQKNDPPA